MIEIIDVAVVFFLKKFNLKINLNNIFFIYF
jgi:hypothetical protein